MPQSKSQPGFYNPLKGVLIATNNGALGVVGAGASLDLVLAACAGTGSGTTVGSTGCGTIASPLSEADKWFADAAESPQCTGTTLNGVTENTAPCGLVPNTILPAFEAPTGITANIEITSWDEMYSKAIDDTEAATGIDDFAHIEQDIVYAYSAQDYLVNMSQWLRDDLDAVAPSFDIELFTSFIDNFVGEKADLFGMPMESFEKLYRYRTDLFEA